VPPEAPRILVIRLSSMGDIILTTPALAALKAYFPRAHLDVVVKERYVQLLQGHPHVDGLFVLSPENGLLSLARQLRGQGHDIALDLHANLRSRLLMLSLPAHRKLRYHKKALQRRLTVLGRHHHGPRVHTVDLYLDCLRPLGIQAQRDRPRLSLGVQDDLFAEDYLRQHNLLQAGPLIGLHPGARWSGKRWSEERFARVGRQLAERRNAPALVFGGPGEGKLATRVAEQIGATAVAAVGVSLRQLMALVARCALFVTNDSGPMHLATALGVPVVAIFGPTHPSLGFWPLGERDVALSADLDCSPCSLHGDKNCPQSWPCLDQIRVKDVLEAAEGILEGRPMAIKKEEKKSAPAAENVSNVAVFLDRDGTINREVHYLSRPEQLELLPGAARMFWRPPRGFWSNIFMKFD